MVLLENSFLIDQIGKIQLDNFDMKPQKWSKDEYLSKLNSLSETISERDDSEITQFLLLKIKYRANLNVN